MGSFTDGLNLGLVGNLAVCNVVADTQPKDVRFLGVVHDLSDGNDNGDPSIVLKFYEMFRHNKPSAHNVDLLRSRNFLEDVLRSSGRNGFNRASGLGFAIVSDHADMVNAVRWSLKYPTVPINTLWVYDGTSRVYKMQSIDSEGSFCRGERAIVDCESAAWDIYLGSPRRDDDKKAYLNYHLPDGELVDAVIHPKY